MITLRNNLSVCKKCIHDDRKNIIYEIESRKNELKKLELWINKPSKSEQNVFSIFFNSDFIGLMFFILMIVYTILYIILSESNLNKIINSSVISVGIVVVIILFFLKLYKDNRLRIKFKNDFERIKAELEYFTTEKNKYYRKLQPFFEQLWEMPPDWEWRRQQVYQREDGNCENCGIYLSNSFDVHHIIPQSEKAGDHSLDNLKLFCRKCHSKIDSRGHSLLKRTKKRYRHR
jgi:hypothetical protein